MEFRLILLHANDVLTIDVHDNDVKKLITFSSNDAIDFSQSRCFELLTAKIWFVIFSFTNLCFASFSVLCVLFYSTNLGHVCMYRAVNHQ